MRKRYNKLVRDRIPEIIEKDGHTPFTHTATDTEYWKKLLEKLQEELNEFSVSDGDPDELAKAEEDPDAFMEELSNNLENRS